MIWQLQMQCTLGMLQLGYQLFKTVCSVKRAHYPLGVGDKGEESSTWTRVSYRNRRWDKQETLINGFYQPLSWSQPTLKGEEKILYVNDLGQDNKIRGITFRVNILQVFCWLVVTIKEKIMLCSRKLALLNSVMTSYRPYENWISLLKGNGLVFLFNGISTLIGYSMPKLFS